MWVGECRATAVNPIQTYFFYVDMVSQVGPLTKHILLNTAWVTFEDGTSLVQILRIPLTHTLSTISHLILYAWNGTSSHWTSHSPWREPWRQSGSPGHFHHSGSLCHCIRTDNARDGRNLLQRQCRYQYEWGLSWSLTDCLLAGTAGRRWAVEGITPAAFEQSVC